MIVFAHVQMSVTDKCGVYSGFMRSGSEIVIQISALECEPCAYTLLNYWETEQIEFVLFTVYGAVRSSSHNSGTKH